MKKLFLLLSIGFSMIAASQPITDTGTLRTYINAEIVTNGTKAITAAKLNRILNGYLYSWPDNSINAVSPLVWNAGTRTISLIGGGVGVTTATNGLHLTTVTVKLGGTITENTTISGGSGFDLSFGSSGARINNLNLYATNILLNASTAISLTAPTFTVTASTGAYFVATTDFRISGGALGSGTSDTTLFKPLGVNSSGYIKKMSYWPGSGGGGTIGDELIGGVHKAGFDTLNYFPSWASNVTLIKSIQINTDGQIVGTKSLTDSTYQFDLALDTTKVPTQNMLSYVTYRSTITQASIGRKRKDQVTFWAKTADSIYAAATNYGTGSGDGSAAIITLYRTRNRAKTWDSVGTIVTSANFNGVPSFFETHGTADTLKMNYLESVSGDIVFKQVYSTNYKAAMTSGTAPTWTSPTIIYNPGGHFSPASHAVVQLDASTFIYPYSVWVSGPVSGLGNWNVGFLISYNKGVTWADLGVTITGPDNYADEPKATKKGNEVYVAIRTRVGWVGYSKATIGTWVFTPVKSIGLHAPSSQSDLIWDEKNQMFICAINPVYKTITGQPEDRNYMSVYVSSDTIGRWEPRITIADNDSNRHFLEPTIYSLGDQYLFGYSDGWYNSPDYYHSLYSKVVPISKLIPTHGNGEVSKLIIEEEMNNWQLEGGHTGDYTGFKYRFRDLGDSAYYWVHNNHNIGRTSFVPEFDSRSKGTDRGLVNRFYRWALEPTEGFLQYDFMNYDGTTSGYPANQIILDVRTSTSLIKSYADGRFHVSGRLKPGGYTTSQIAALAAPVQFEILGNTDSSLLQFYNGSAWVNIGSGGGGGGSVGSAGSGLTLTGSTFSWGGSLTGTTLLDANSNYIAYTELPNMRWSNTASFTFLMGDMSGATDNKWWGWIVENGNMVARPYSDALSGGSDFMTFDRLTPEIKIGIPKMRFAAANPFLQFANTTTGGAGLQWGAYNAQMGLAFGNDAGNVGTVAGDMFFRVDGTKYSWSVDNGGSAAMTLSSTGSLKLTSYAGSGSQLAYFSNVGDLARTSINISDVGLLPANQTFSGNNTFTGNVTITVTEYTDNAAAVSAGLGVGRLYRTGDVLKIVH